MPLIGLLATATIIPALDVAGLTRNSDLIVVGLVSALQDGSAVSIDFQGNPVVGRQMLTTFQVVRMVKGNFNASELTFSFFVPNQSLGYRSISKGQFGMFFLRHDSAVGYTITNPYYPWLVAARKAPKLRGKENDRVLSETLNVLSSGDGSPEERMAAVEVLKSVQNEAANSALKLASGDTDLNVRFLAMAYLLRRNDVSQITSAEQALLKPAPTTNPYVVSRLLVGIQSVRDPRGVPALLRLLAGGVTETRRSAAGALAEIGDSTSIPGLSVALYDSDRLVRYYAVSGLANITDQDDWGPSLPSFETDEERFLAHWREWVKKR